MHCIFQCWIALYISVLYCTVYLSVVLHCISQCCIAPYISVLYCTVYLSVVLHCISQCCIALYVSVLYCNVYLSVVLQCISALKWHNQHCTISPLLPNLGPFYGSAEKSSLNWKRPHNNTASQNPKAKIITFSSQPLQHPTSEHDIITT